MRPMPVLEPEALVSGRKVPCETVVNLLCMLHAKLRQEREPQAPIPPVVVKNLNSNAAIRQGESLLVVPEGRLEIARLPPAFGLLEEILRAAANGSKEAEQKNRGPDWKAGKTAEPVRGGDLRPHGWDAQYWQFCRKLWHRHPACVRKTSHGQDAHATYPDSIGRDAPWFFSAHFLPWQDACRFALPAIRRWPCVRWSREFHLPFLCNSRGNPFSSLARSWTAAAA
jgi:hypothetical protein